MKLLKRHKNVKNDCKTFSCSNLEYKNSHHTLFSGVFAVLNVISTQNDHRLQSVSSDSHMYGTSKKAFISKMLYIFGKLTLCVSLWDIDLGIEVYFTLQRCPLRAGKFESHAQGSEPIKSIRIL